MSDILRKIWRITEYQYKDVDCEIKGGKVTWNKKQQVDGRIQRYSVKPISSIIWKNENVLGKESTFSIGSILTSRWRITSKREDRSTSVEEYAKEGVSRAKRVTYMKIQG